MNKVANNITVENARIGFRNFSGKAGQYNPAGRRTFSWFIDDDKMAKTLFEDGWNVKWLKAREEGEAPQAHMPVMVAFNKFPPKIVLVTSRGKTVLDEEDVNLLDWAEIKNVDMILRPYNWDVNGKSGVKAYLKSMFITIAEDELEQKYSDVPMSAQSLIVSEPNDEGCPW